MLVRRIPFHTSGSNRLAGPSLVPYSAFDVPSFRSTLPCHYCSNHSRSASSSTPTAVLGLDLLVSTPKICLRRCLDAESSSRPHPYPVPNWLQITPSFCRQTACYLPVDELRTWPCLLKRTDLDLTPVRQTTILLPSCMAVLPIQAHPGSSPYRCSYLAHRSHGTVRHLLAAC